MDYILLYYVIIILLYALLFITIETLLSKQTIGFCHRVRFRLTDCSDVFFSAGQFDQFADSGTFIALRRTRRPASKLPSSDWTLGVEYMSLLWHFLVGTAEPIWIRLTLPRLKNGMFIINNYLIYVTIVCTKESNRQ